MDLNVTTNSTQSRDHSPSRVAKRLVVLGGTVLGFGIAARLAAYQLRLLPAPPDPFFGGGSERVLNSPLSRFLPIPDAALGAIAYFCEAVLIIIGGGQRFITMPIVVLAYTVLALLMGFVGLGLTLYQLGVLHAACTLCLGSAVLSWILTIPALTEGRCALVWLLRSGTHNTPWRQ